MPVLFPSFFGLYYYIRVKILKHLKGMQYPLKPIKPSLVENVLSRNGMRIVQIKGISPLPFGRGAISSNKLVSKFCKICIYALFNFIR